MSHPLALPGPQGTQGNARVNGYDGWPAIAAEGVCSVMHDRPDVVWQILSGHQTRAGYIKVTLYSYKKKGEENTHGYTTTPDVNRQAFYTLPTYLRMGAQGDRPLHHKNYSSHSVLQLINIHEHNCYGSFFHRQVS
jgi:hypothetical protein